MQDVIYSVAVGPRYVRLAQMMVDSLRWAGWDGRVVLFADARVRGAETIEYKGDVMQTLMLRASVWLDWPLDCDRALFCDSDILWRRSPQALFDYAEDAGTHYAFAEGSLKAAGHWTMKYYLDDREIGDHHLAYNAGLVCASRRCWIKGAGQWIVDDYIGADQPAFNKAAVRGEIKVEPFPADWMNFEYPGFPSHADPVLEHHMGAGKDEMAVRYRCMREANNAVTARELAKDPACQATAAERLRVCSTCPNSASVSPSSVICKAVGDRRINPFVGKCKLRKWPAVVAQSA